MKTVNPDLTEVNPTDVPNSVRENQTDRVCALPRDIASFLGCTDATISRYVSEGKARRYGRFVDILDVFAARAETRRSGRPTQQEA